MSSYIISIIMILSAQALFVSSYDNHCNGQTSQLIVSGEENSTTLRPLTPIALYFTRIAENALGQSRLSTLINVTTEEEAPSPREVQVHSTGAQSIKPPSEETQNDHITAHYFGYRITSSWKSYTFQEVDTNADEGQQSSYITGLQPFTKSDTVAKAFNSVGDGLKTNKIMSKTLETAPTSPVVQLESTTSSSIDVSWKKDVKDKSAIPGGKLNTMGNIGDNDIGKHFEKLVTPLSRQAWTNGMPFLGEKFQHSCDVFNNLIDKDFYTKNAFLQVLCSYGKQILKIQVSGEASVRNELLSGLQSLDYEDGDPIVMRERDNVIKIVLGAGKLQFQCQDYAKPMDSGSQLKLDAHLLSIYMTMEIVHNTDGWNPKVKKFKVKYVKASLITATGLGSLEHSFKKYMDFTLTNIFESLIKSKIEDGLIKYLFENKNEIPVYNLDSFLNIFTLNS